MPRRTEITDAGLDMEDEDLIPREDMVATVSHPATSSVCRCRSTAQRRGGKGRSGMSTKDEDGHPAVRGQHAYAGAVLRRAASSTRKRSAGRPPIGNPQSRGKALINLLPLEQGERITTIPCRCPEDETSWGELDVMFATTRGTVRRNKLSDFVQSNCNGKIAMKLEEEGDEIRRRNLHRQCTMCF